MPYPPPHHYEDSVCCFAAARGQPCNCNPPISAERTTLRASEALPSLISHTTTYSSASEDSSGGIEWSTPSTAVPPPITSPENFEGDGSDGGHLELQVIEGVDPTYPATPPPELVPITYSQLSDSDVEALLSEIQTVRQILVEEENPVARDLEYTQRARERAQERSAQIARDVEGWDLLDLQNRYRDSLPRSEEYRRGQSSQTTVVNPPVAQFRRGRRNLYHSPTFEHAELQEVPAWGHSTPPAPHDSPLAATPPVSASSLRRQEARGNQRKALKFSKQENLPEEIERAMKFATLRLKDEWWKMEIEKKARERKEWMRVPFLRVPPEIHLRILGELHVVDGVCLSLVKYELLSLSCFALIALSVSPSERKMSHTLHFQSHARKS